ncbi:MAG: sensor domain-containing diguanylate cyclase [Spirochaetales bacterium]|nr:sensor domain-containing diguanylate cyclase [Spirochaetales bacterium]
MNGDRLLNTINGIITCFNYSNTDSAAIKESLRMIYNDFPFIVLVYYFSDDHSRAFRSFIRMDRFGIREMSYYGGQLPDHLFRDIQSTESSYAIGDDGNLWLKVSAKNRELGIMHAANEEVEDIAYLQRRDEISESDRLQLESGKIVFDDETINYFSQICRILGTCLANRSVPVEADRGSQTVTRFSSIISEIIGTFDIDRILSLLIMHAVKLLSIDRARLYLVDAGEGVIRGTLRYELLSGLTGIENQEFPLMKEDNSVLNFFQAELDAVFPGTSLYRDLIRVTQLKVKQKIIGFFIVDNFVCRQPISESDSQSLDVLLQQASVAIENAQLYGEIEVLATRDSLTGLFNSRYFNSQLELQLKKTERYGDTFSVLMMDVDFFKNYNDAYGHQTGDMILQEIGKIISKAVRETDVAARYGGDEFILLLLDADFKKNGVIAERIRQAVESMSIVNDDSNLYLTISIGGITLNGDTIPSEQIIEQADKCLYEAKKNGRNRCVVKKIVA